MKGPFGHVLRLLLILQITLWLASCQSNQNAPAQISGEPAENAQERPFFTEQVESSGVDFVHHNGMYGDYHFPEIMGSGGALFDFDQDGDMDLYLCQGQSLSGPPIDHGGGRLYRNDTKPGEAFHFTDVTEAAGIRATRFGIGAASGDIDNDGFPDLYLLNVDGNQMYRNLGDGRFEDISNLSGTDDDSWSVSATFFDYDRDGWLDLFVANYVDYTPESNKTCTQLGRDYCNPQSYNPVPDRLFRNLGNGRFEDVTAASRIATDFGNGLGVLSADFDQDGWVDIYVANDGTPNQLWHNLGNGTFEEVGLLGGSALNLKGIAEASMGVTFGDYDADGDGDLFMTHLRSETNTLFESQSMNATTRFKDSTIAANLATSSRSLTGFGTGWIDADNDSLLDLLVVNGSVTALEDLIAAGVPFPYAQPNQFFRNLGGGRFQEAYSFIAQDSGTPAISRGALFGDLDNDGDTDVVISNNHSRPSILRNDVGADANWLGLRLTGTQGGRDMLGANLVLKTEAGKALLRHVHSDGSFASANDPRVIFGLGSDRPKRLEITWPDGQRESIPIADSRKWVTIRQGVGLIPPSP